MRGVRGLLAGQPYAANALRAMLSASSKLLALHPLPVLVLPNGRYGFVKCCEDPLFADSLRDVVPIHV